MTTNELTTAQQREHDRLERVRRWRIVARMVARGEAPKNAHIDDYDWTPARWRLAAPRAARPAASPPNDTAARLAASTGDA